jgi:ketosteroid isomerase-like protein
LRYAQKGGVEAPHVPQLSAEAPHVPLLSAEECAVWKREQSFAKSVADHDATAFADHVSEQAAFGASRPEPTRGRDAIVKRWTGLIEGKHTRLSWYPTRVTIAGGTAGGASDVAWSSGPALIEVLDPKAKDAYQIGSFRSVWHKDADGVWRVLFDDGEEPRPASAEEVRTFKLGRAECDAGV